MVRISLFGLPGTGTSSVGKWLANKYSLEFKSSGDMFRGLAQTYNMSLAEFGAYCETHPQVDKELDSTIKEFGEKNDNFIFDSRLAWLTIPNSFKVKLYCGDDERARRIVEREGGEREEVKKVMSQREESERRRYYQYYGIEDYMDDSHFDIVLDTTYTQIEEASSYIEDRLNL